MIRFTVKVTLVNGIEGILTVECESRFQLREILRESFGIELLDTQIIKEEKV